MEISSRFRTFTLFICEVFLENIWIMYNNKIQLLPNVELPEFLFLLSWPGASKNLLVAEIIEPYKDGDLAKLANLRQLKVTNKAQSASFEVEITHSTDLWASNRAYQQLSKPRQQTSGI